MVFREMFGIMVDITIAYVANVNVVGVFGIGRVNV